MRSRPPDFCPNPDCHHHHAEAKPKGWFKRYGSYETIAFGMVPRFRCLACGRGFSTQTFSIDYFAKKRVSYRRMFTSLKATGSVRDMKRDLGISTGTVQNRLERLARNALALHARLRPLASFDESLAADGFESFCVSQFFPDNTHLIAGRDSQFVYLVNHVILRRKGRMTAKQKERRKTLEKQYKADPAGIDRTFAMLLHDLLAIPASTNRHPIHLATDRKLEYDRQIKRRYAPAIAHERVSSREARTVDNPLFAVNYLDREIRKDLANHVRETTCHSRNVSNSMGRMMIYLVYHNYLKLFRENQEVDDSTTHAHVAGIPQAAVDRELRCFFTRRAFLSLEDMDAFGRDLWLRRLVTPLKKRPEYLPQFAAA